MAQRQRQPDPSGKMLAEHSSIDDYDSFLSALAIPDTFAVRLPCPRAATGR